MGHKFRLGRQPRKFNPTIPHLSALMGAPMRRHMPTPVDVDNTTSMPPDLGIMLNDHLGDCTSAAKYHARQVRTLVAQGHMVTESNACVLKFYEESCGYVDGNPETDLGGNMQDVLRYELYNGLPVGDGSKRVGIVAFMEVDPRNHNDMLLAIDECGLVDVGFSVPAFLMPDDGSDPPLLWDTRPGPPAQIIGGHDVILPGKVGDKYRVISWGSPKYQMTEAFCNEYVTEAYAIITEEWITSTGKTPFGLSLADWENLMRGLR